VDFTNRKIERKLCRSDTVYNRFRLQLRNNMLSNRCLEACTACTIIIFLGTAVVCLCIGIVGTGMYFSERNAESVYKPTSCFVKNYTRIEKKCSKQSCTGSGNRKTCRTKYYSCHEHFYALLYNVATDREIAVFEGTDGPRPDRMVIVWILRTISDWTYYLESL
jgi:hypothetical protein